jgi:hypothetical protein
MTVLVERARCVSAFRHHSACNGFFSEFAAARLVLPETIMAEVLWDDIHYSDPDASNQIRHSAVTQRNEATAMWRSAKPRDYRGALRFCVTTYPACRPKVSLSQHQVARTAGGPNEKSGRGAK